MCPQNAAQAAGLEDGAPADLTAEELSEFFPARTADVEKGVFEIGLALGGTVSAGAYTGGVLDFIVEALDAWQRAKDAADPDAPRHRLVITNIAGASGGAINGAILLRGAGREFPHGPAADNPFFSAWTKNVDLMALLSPVNDAAGFASVLNCAPIERTVDETIRWNKGVPLGTATSPGRRSYLADPLRLFMMVGNVTGIPYVIDMKGNGLTHEMVTHTDYMRFGLRVEGGMPQTVVSRPDELAVNSTDDTNWVDIGRSALATSAFPFAFKARRLARPLRVAGYRALAIPSDKKDEPATIRQLVPKWSYLPRDESDPAVAPFVNVDGGTFNNEPLDVVRTAMAGLGGRNPRDPTKATRAVILIDPFSDPQMLSVPDAGKLTNVLLPLLSSLMQQPRFKAEDLALAYDENVYSRFLIAPVGRNTPNPSGDKVVGAKAIASGGLGGFLGFLDNKLLVHDYLLGRANAYAFLKRHFLLPEEPANALFDEPFWTPRQKDKYRYTDPGTRKTFLPLIPIMDSVAPPEDPTWPQGTDLPAGFGDAVSTRLDVVYGKLKAQLTPDSWPVKLLVNVGVGLSWRLFIRRALRDAVVGAMDRGLRDQKLKP